MEKKTGVGGRVMDMTQGNSMKLIVTFAVPLLIGTLFQQI